MVSQSMPEDLRPLFWDHDFDRLAWPADADFIIARVLQEGDDKATVWLQRQMSAAELATWIRAHQGRGLDPRRIRFWQLILDLPDNEVVTWIRESNASPGKVQ